jgi:hypothetical protein
MVSDFAIAENYDYTNHTTGIHRHPGSKQIASNSIVQAKPKQLVLIQTSNFRHVQNPQCQNNEH